MAKLGEICKINMGQSPDSSTYNNNKEGIPFFQGNADFGKINPTIRLWCSNPVKIAKENDILISVRAPIGALNISDCECCIGRGLASLTITTDKCIQKFLWYSLINRTHELISKGTGSTFKAINKQILFDLKIPLPPLEEQEKIAMVLDKVSELIEKREQQLAKLDELIKSRFVEMFGDPVTNSLNMPLLSLQELGKFGRGVSKHRPRNAPELLGGKYPLIQTGEIANAGLYINSFENTYSELGLKQSKIWQAGTLGITIAANIAKTAILTFDACFPDSVVGFTANKKSNNIFIHYWFSFFQQILEAQAPESAQKNINLKILSELKVITPPIEFQNQFAEFVEQTEKIKVAINSSLDKLKTLKKALMQRFFG